MLDLPEFSLAAGGGLFSLLKAVARLAEELGFILLIDAVICETASGESAFHLSWQRIGQQVSVCTKLSFSLTLLLNADVQVTT